MRPVNPRKPWVEPRPRLHVEQILVNDPFLNRPVHADARADGNIGKTRGAEQRASERRNDARDGQVPWPRKPEEHAQCLGERIDVRTIDHRGPILPRVAAVFLSRICGGHSGIMPRATASGGPFTAA